MLKGGTDGDSIIGGAGNDILEGGAGNDSLDGYIWANRQGNDILRGGDGDDGFCYPWIGEDTGDDIFIGGSGNDVVNVNAAKISAYKYKLYSKLVTSFNHEVENWWLGGTSGNDTIDASAWTGAGVQLMVVKATMCLRAVAEMMT